MNGEPLARDAVHQALVDLTALLPPGLSLAEAPDEAPLADAAGGPLDSLGIVNLMVGVEAAVQARAGVAVSMAESLAEPLETSPYRTRATLVAWVAELLGQPGSGAGGGDTP